VVIIAVEPKITGFDNFDCEFKTLLTHNSTEAFTEEKSKPFTPVKAVNNKILCNGSSCNHIAYCKFFSHSDGLVHLKHN
jgi:hypothetical protein